MTNKKDLGTRSGLMGLNMKVTIEVDLKMGRENSFGLRKNFTRENLLKIESKDTESIIGLMAVIIRESG